jgi:hypothetical protein
MSKTKTNQQKNALTKGMTQEDLNQFLEDLSLLEHRFLEENKLFLEAGGKNKELHMMDLFFSAIANRSIAFIRGFITLVRDDNYIAAVPFIRMQIDNCLRFYATTLVSDMNDFYLKYLEGTHIGQIEDAEGNKMYDTYLVEKLDENLFPGIRNLYKNTSGYVHLSNEHTFLQTKYENDKLSVRSGKFDFFSIDKKVDFVFNMLKASEFLLTLLESWKFQKAIMIDNN